MIPLTAIIPVRLNCAERLDSLMAVTQFLLNQVQVEQIIISEADVRPRLLGCVDHQRINWHYTQINPTWAWNRGRVVNVTLPFVNTKYVAVWDVDGLVCPAAVHQSLSLLGRNQADYIVPWSRVLYLKRDAPLRDAVLADRWIESDVAHAHTTSTTAAGLIHITSTALFRHVRGFNELFHGWGGEDSEILARVGRLGYRVMRLELDAAHLYHPTAGSVPDSESIGLSQGEVDRIMSLDAQGLREYMGIGEKPGRYVHLRRPDPYITKPVAARPTTSA